MKTKKMSVLSTHVYQDNNVSNIRGAQNGCEQCASNCATGDNLEERLDGDGSEIDGKQRWSTQVQTI